MSSSPKLGGMPPLHLSEALLAEIEEIGRRRLPSEACGLLLPEPLHRSQVVELPNRSLTPHDSYTIWPDDIEVAIGAWAHSVGEAARNAVAIWHTHPRGNVGPSRGDMRQRLDGVPYLVVALTGDQAIPTWF